MFECLVRRLLVGEASSEPLVATNGHHVSEGHFMDIAFSPHITSYISHE